MDHEAFGAHLRLPRRSAGRVSRIGRALSAPGRRGDLRRTCCTPSQARLPSAARSCSRRRWLKPRNRARLLSLTRHSRCRKSITLLHASARAMKLAAEEAGDIRRRGAGAGAGRHCVARHFRGRGRGDGAPAAPRRLHPHGRRQACARRTRTGGSSASWRQHTSRAGDPQLHIHQTILNKVRTERDGGMRTHRRPGAVPGTRRRRRRSAPW